MTVDNLQRCLVLFLSVIIFIYKMYFVKSIKFFHLLNVSNQLLFEMDINSDITNLTSPMRIIIFGIYFLLANSQSL
jgi:hypothetical protein